MDEFVEKIYKCLTIEGKRLSVVKNSDGFLLRPDTQQAVLKASGLLLLPIHSALELRVRYELVDKNSEARVCYVMEHSVDILPDIACTLYFASPFYVSSLIPACNSAELKKHELSFYMVSYIYRKKYIYDLSAEETREVAETACLLASEEPTYIVEGLKKVALKWDQVDTMDALCNLLLKAIRKGNYWEVREPLQKINSHFQNYLLHHYFSLPSSNYQNKPKIVSRILPYILSKHEKTDRVALIVVDGMSYWQYLLLDSELRKLGIQPKKDITYAWIPSITKLSRQSIFRGESPRLDYIQSPAAEKNLWMDFWTSKEQLANKRLHSYELTYTHGSLTMDDYLVYKKAFVDVDLDNKMHSSSHNKDLYDLTMNWAKSSAEDIKGIFDKGYQIYITTDHGNIYAEAWRNLTPQEKTFLYKNESRGSRHLMYSESEYLNDFVERNLEMKEQWMIHDNWLVWATDKCFKNQNEITHGGSHFLEVVIPFVTIDKKENDG